MTDKTGNYRGWLRGWRLGATGLFGGNFKNIFLVSREKNETKQNKTRMKKKMSDCYPIQKLSENMWQTNVKVAVKLWLKNAALIQWHKLKKETPGIPEIDMLNGIIPGHAFKISRESDRIEGRLSRRSLTASITNQTLNRKGNCKNRKGHEEKLCRLTILKSELISVEKWEADLCAI